LLRPLLSRPAPSPARGFLLPAKMTEYIEILAMQNL
jgi:hypothetical protein